MSELPNETRALAVVLEADPDVAAVLSLQLHVLGMESRYYRQGALMLDEIAECRPQLVIMGLEFDEVDGIAMLRLLAEREDLGSIASVAFWDALKTRYLAPAMERLGSFETARVQSEGRAAGFEAAIGRALEAADR